jgi:hypothetical protein
MSTPSRTVTPRTRKNRRILTALTRMTYRFNGVRFCVTVFPTTILASYEALPRLSYSPVFFSPVFLCLPSEADASIFFHITYGVSLFLAEVTQVNSISVSPIQEAFKNMAPCPVA